MSEPIAADIEGLLRQAFRPVEPPESLATRLESTLQELTELAAVQELPDDRREALIMRFALGMDNREIARAMQRSDGATKVLIHRAIKQLEELVGDPRQEAADE